MQYRSHLNNHEMQRSRSQDILKKVNISNTQRENSPFLNIQEQININHPNIPYYRYNDHNTLISTTLSHNVSQKSKISHIPQHKKNQSRCPQIILVFQAIQIQRLTTQVQRQRTQIKFLQGQIFTFKNYQVQIRELNQMCFNMERQTKQKNVNLQKIQKHKQDLIRQNEILMSQIESLKRQISSLNRKIQSVENDFQLKNKQMKSQRQRLSLNHENQITNRQKQISKLNQKVINLSVELQRLIQVSKEKQHLIQQLRKIDKKNKDKIALLQTDKIQMQQCVQQWKQVSYKFENLEKRAANLEYQNSSLKSKINLLFEQKQNYFRQFKKKENDYQNLKKTLFENDQQIKRYKNIELQFFKNEQLLRKANQQKIDLRYKNESLSSQINNLKNEILDIQNKLHFLTCDSKRAIETMTIKHNQEILTLQRRNQKLEAESHKMQEQFNSYIRLESKLVESQNHNKILIQQIQKLNVELRKSLNDERKYLNIIQQKDRQYKEADIRLSTSKDKVSIINQQLQYLKKLNRQKAQMIQILKQQLNRIQRQLRQLKILRQNQSFQLEKAKGFQNEVMRSRNQIQIQKQKQYDLKKNNQKKILQLQGKLLKKIQENQQLQNKNKTNDFQIRRLRQQIASKQNQLYRANELQGLLNHKNNDLRSYQNLKRQLEGKINDIQRQCDDANHKNEQASMKILIMGLQIQKLHKEKQKVQQKQEKINKLRLQAQKYKNQFQSKSEQVINLDFKVSQLQSRIITLKRDSQIVQETVKRAFQQKQNIMKQFDEYKRYAQMIILQNPQIKIAQSKYNEIKQFTRKLRQGNLTRRY